MNVIDDDGREVDASFDLSADAYGLVLTIHARGGSGAKAVNREYPRGLLVLVERLRARGAEITDVVVDSIPSRRLPMRERRLALAGRPYPIRLDETSDVAGLCRDLMREQQSVGQSGNERGGNRTKRIQIKFSIPDEEDVARSIASWLQFGRTMFGPAAIDVEAARLATRKEFDPSDERDARARTMRAIAARRGQAPFRKELIAAYQGMCAFTRSDSLETLEAAHIRPFRGDHTNSVRNGLLLRADLHVLFDRRLVTVDLDSGGSWTVVVSPSLRGSTYRAIAGVDLHLPMNPRSLPSPEALRLHRNECGF